MTGAATKSGLFPITREVLDAEYQWCYVWDDVVSRDERLDPRDISVIMESTLKTFLKEYCVA